MEKRFVVSPQTVDYSITNIVDAIDKGNKLINWRKIIQRFAIIRKKYEHPILCIDSTVVFGRGYGYWSICRLQNISSTNNQLLDFTYSHIISLMFAVEKAFDYDENDTGNAVVWFLNSQKLNHSAKQKVRAVYHCFGLWITDSL